MKRCYIILFVFTFCAPAVMKAQYGFKNMVELTGIIMSSDSLRYLPFVSVQVEETSFGVVSNKKGVFSTIVPKGSKIKFSSLGFKDVYYKIPDTLSQSRYSVIQLMVQDTFYLPTTIVRPLMTREEFERAFVKLEIPPDQIEVARQNTSKNTIRALAFTLPKDGNENLDLYQKTEADRLYWQGGAPPGGITAMPGGGFAINPMAFAEFFKAWKRGDFKRK